ncbi:glucodextranase DOMON-like domain-containing protein [Haloarcula marina]|uniref:alpha-amylase family glycosyl hydrolase n=1 Tax=Haloarcula marina TaxID=2961574 RepID=UPI0020B79310|nr:alpha-amylase family glycosyl hydrolase [Halomicroarcula marina]
MTGGDTSLTRRHLLLAAALSGLAGCPGGGSDSASTETDQSAATATTTETQTETGPTVADAPQAEVRGAHAPGPPVFTSVGEAIRAPEFAGVESNLAPRNPDREGTYAWSVADAPDESEAAVGDGAAVEFEPDVAGTYTLALDAPDGTHETTVRAFPRQTAGDPRPTLTLSSEQADDSIVLTADARAPASNDESDDDLTVEFLVDDRDREAMDGTLAVDGHEARLSVENLSGPVRVHAAAVGATGRSVADTLRIAPDGTTTHPTGPPAWAEDAVVYEIFVRRFGADVDFDFLESTVDYIDSMGADAVWLTPILDAHSHRDETQPGGPHGYDVIDYFETADALGSRAQFESFVDACHERGIKVIFDLVVNHTAREHPYFQSATGGEDAPFRDWYRWEGGDAQYYFGWRGIPILDFDNPAVRSWVLAIAEEWADVVDGFRCDVAWGLPHSFWKEFRQRIKAEHPDFLLLAEAVPWQDDYADFAENEFGLHYAEGLFETLGAIGSGEESADALRDVCEWRRDAGYPDHVSLLNYVENHDTDRYLADASRAAQMAAGAATFTLPGAPMVYYGQETGLTGMRERMNWERADEDLRAFYRNLAAVRHDERALQSDADVIPLSVAPGNDRVTGYAREMEGERVHVLLNFAEDAVEVAQHPAVERTDRVSGDSVGTAGGVTVDSVAVLRADGLAGRGERVATYDDPSGDAAAPDGVPAAALDLRGLDVYETDDAHQFVWPFADLPDGGAHQHLQLYLRDPDADGGTTDTRDGIDASLTESAQYRAIRTPEDAVLERADGTGATDLDTRIVGDEIRLTVPNEYLPAESRELRFTALVAGYDTDAPGEVAQVGGSNVADVVVGPLTDESAVRSGSGATLPLVSLSTGVRNLRLDAAPVATWTDPTGDDHGPGSYTYPDSSRWPDGTLDLTRFGVFAGDERYHFQFGFRGPVETNRRGSRKQHVQVYLRDPDASGGGTAAREGIGADIAPTYHYRVVASGTTTALEATDGTVLTEDVTVETRDGLDGLWVSVPADALGDVATMELVPLVVGNSLTGPGGVAVIEAERSVTDFGGRTSEFQSNVVDLLTPAGVTQSEMLAAESERPAVPLLSVARGGERGE